MTALAATYHWLYDWVMRRLPLASMEAFVVVARCRSLAQAAQIMNLTVPALSRRIRQLEIELGVKLFQRLPRGLALTESGSAYYSSLGPAWDNIAAATESTRRLGHRRALKVSVMPTFAANWLVPRLTRFQTRNPSVELELHSAADVIDLQIRRDIDCAIRLGRGPWPGLHCEPILPVNAFPVARPGFAETGMTPRDLLGCALIGTDHQPEFWQEWFAASGIDATPTAYRRFDNLQLVYEAAAAGMGIALGVSPVINPYLESRRLQRLFSDDVGLSRCFHLIRRHDGTASDRNFIRFREWLHAEATVACCSSLAAEN